MSHDSTARKVFGVTLETIVRRILRTFDVASKSDIESGIRWYDEAGELASTLARDISLEQAASVIAALSPKTMWGRNVAGAVALITSGPAAALRLGCMKRSVEIAQRAKINGFAALNGAKTNAFARNIAGDREAVTVDVWACRVANLDETVLDRVGAYKAVAHAYRLAARRRGVDPTTMQAVCWIVARNGRTS